MKKYDPRIESVAVGSIAEAAGIRPGDRLLAIDGVTLRDVIDYEFMLPGEELTLTVAAADGTVRDVDVVKDDDEDLGIGFAAAVFDGVRVCRNRCAFCFVDQMIPGGRDSLYLKDDDYRLSFLYGSYITLTNLSDADIDRVKSQRLSPLFVSVHCLDPVLRRELLGIKKERPLLPLLKELSDSGIELHGQIVLVPGVNDGKYLAETVDGIAAIAGFRSLALVPVGLTKKKNPALRLYRQAEAAEIIDYTTRCQERFLAEKGTRFLFASDEFYLLADAPIPDEAAYEDYPQIENGVGLIRDFWSDHAGAPVDAPDPFPVGATVSVITAVDGAYALRPIVRDVKERCGLELRIITVENSFFGASVTVTGLLTGGDIIAALREHATGGICLLPDVLLKHHTDLLLDDVSVAEIAAATGCDLRVVETRGSALAEAVAELREEWS